MLDFAKILTLSWLYSTMYIQNPFTGDWLHCHIDKQTLINKHNSILIVEEHEADWATTWASIFFYIIDILYEKCTHSGNFDTQTSPVPNCSAVS